MDAISCPPTAPFNISSGSSKPFGKLIVKLSLYTLPKKVA